MGLYNKYILPNLIISSCNKKPQMKQREKIIPFAEGKVLEVGIGSGLNLRFYDPNKVTELIGIDPSLELWKKRDPIEELGFHYEFIEGVAQDMPFEKHFFDTIVITYTLCSIPDFQTALESFRKVLKPSGKFLFCEHGKAPDKSVLFTQNAINPIWKAIGGGCNINRDIPTIINQNGFKISDLKTMYVPGWKPLSFNYWGEAKLN
ncbi:MAG: class I SAM-dependent methyltransferase [Flavobacteriaceae bacterium]|jgi:ubiquinone/menaquinone biosynthesis C-methylase UbiE|nr:class I SAM-dependent methyltransferase [Flavobacteriaceae bacterium]|tara:strand:- start:2185 stop:2799 length:615 start_codon:yes stop_codon:yes gene_type:complete